MADWVIKIKIQRYNTLGILVWEYADYEQIKKHLCKKMDSMSKFLNKGCPRVLIAGKDFSEGQKRELSWIIKTDYNVSDVSFCTEEHMERISETHDFIDTQAGVSYKCGDNSIFKMCDVPGGEKVEAGGDLTIIGNVSFGAELIAKGNICVLGALRGSAYAGAAGDENAIIVANTLEATRLRIANCVGVAPKDNISIGAPEFAHICDGGIVIEPVDEGESAFDDDEKQRGIIGSIKRFFTYEY